MRVLKLTSMLGSGMLLRAVCSGMHFANTKISKKQVKIAESKQSYFVAGGPVSANG